MQAGDISFRTDIFLQQTYLIGGHEQFIVSAVFNMQIILMEAAHFQRLHTQIFADAMIDMHHIIARLDLAKMGYLLSRCRCMHSPAFLAAEDIFSVTTTSRAEAISNPPESTPS